MSYRKQVVIVGGGFGGLACARALRRSNVDITLVDRRNFHLFQPLLYQVATGGLSPANIAAPLRNIFKRQKNLRVLMAEVVGFQHDPPRVLLDHYDGLPFDYLVLATGSTHHYFGRDRDWEQLAPGLKTIEDATTIRRKVLSAFEEAERCHDVTTKSAQLTFVIVGGGPTGLEMAGAICELAHQTMRHEFRQINPATARIVLIENSPDILNAFHPSLRESAKQQLIGLGVEVWNDTRLTDIQTDHVTVHQNGQDRRIDTRTVIWAAGVKASPLGTKLAESLDPPPELDRAGRVLVNRACCFDQHRHVFVIGDLAHFAKEDGTPLPGVAPVAMQQGKYVGQLIAANLRGRNPDKPFRYVDKGNMATIGRSRAVAESAGIRFTGKIAWLAWLFIHILYLARFENRILVLFQWFWNYITRNRCARLITDSTEKALDQTNGTQ